MKQHQEMSLALLHCKYQNVTPCVFKCEWPMVAGGWSGCANGPGKRAHHPPPQAVLLFTGDHPQLPQELDLEGVPFSGQRADRCAGGGTAASVP